MVRLRSIAMCMFFLALAASVTLAQQVLNNESIIKLQKAGMGDDIIVQTINAEPGEYRTGADDLIALKTAGVSQRVIAAMIVKSTATAPAPAEATASPFPGVDEVGVYYKDKNGKWNEMDPELVNFKSGGFMKSFATDGIVKQDRNGHINGPTAKLAVVKPVEFLMYVTEGTSPDEYLLLKLRPSNGKSREFRSQTGGVFHSSTGASRDDVAFTATKVATRMYKFTLPIDAPIGEYGILPPGAISSSNAASAGKIYTFSVKE